jgi:hypothetical protein
MERIEKYVKRSCPEIKIVKCDDEYYSSSFLLLIPHPTPGITIKFVPRLYYIRNQFFLYENHYKQLISKLEEMKYVYNYDDSINIC